MNLRKIFRLWRGFGSDLRILVPLLKDKRVPFRWKIPVIAALLYFIFPMDLFADFVVPGLGYIDDLVILVWAVRYFLGKVPSSIRAEYLG